ncbi:hypothetical protein [Catellatospora bangladeshensis]|uniref:Integral membrane protein n=1 Tax=Catellatospora bangladeshensis TaxID=310355 RepID=A0A8J3NN78_9ACTN|nr:hypothetical protein [Catellatospora bangladeshensis]GIF84590.1 hypothetical protein Cba03nite_59390 [Catellatospora bangladeshensis]
MLDTDNPAAPAGAAFPPADRIATALAAALVAASITAGAALNLLGTPVQAQAAPLYALWRPHLGPGTPAALAVAAAVILHGPRLAATLPWRRLMAAGYTAAAAWTMSLAMIDGWRVGLAGRLTAQAEYLTEVPGVTDIPAMLAGFTGRILDFQPDSWTTHVSGHPPGALLIFVWLDRIGLGGGGPAALTCVATGALASVAVPVTLRALGSETAARAAVPYLVLLPGAVWIGASADGMFAGLTSTSLALLAVALTSGRRALAACTALAAGALLAFACHLSYGLVLLAPLAAVVVLAAVSRGHRHAAGPVLAMAATAAGAVVVAFSAAGFWWLDGYHLVVQRYYQGIAAERAYGYWAWANLAAFLLSAGPAAAVIARRATAAVRHDRAAHVLLPLAALLAVAAADLSGLSKAEVERIWLPFAVWLPAGAALLPASSRRGWLLAGATIALAVNHLLLTIW